ncbi:MAG: prolyl oligopeptidase family serine peptidase, partial [Planctomycetes bacterium]|nr:prolyl oligopeptidase family serine peptidase [Planctomycetota bacterium]
MRNILPLAILGFVLLLILGIIGGSAFMLGRGLLEAFNEAQKEPPPATKKKGEEPPVPVNPKEYRNLLEARKDFFTEQQPSTFIPIRTEPVAVPSAEVRKYPTPLGPMSAYVSKDRKDGIRRAAVVWAHSGYGGIEPATWKQAQVLQDAGVLMCPSYRGENQNPGRFEMLYGEVDDLLAAVDYVSKRDDVDPNHVYVVGHGAGGTLALLAATTGTTKIRAVFAISGMPDFDAYLRSTNGLADRNPTPPFNPTRPGESRLRTAQTFVAGIQQPTFFFEAFVREQSRLQGEEMQRQAMQRSIIFRSFSVPRANADSLVDPILGLIANKI